MSSTNKRRETDFMKLLMSDFTVETINDAVDEFNVVFLGPKESPYDGGVWRVHVKLPDTYPFKPPSVGFLNKIFHPNIDEHSGAVCLNVIHQSWSPMFDLVNVFEIFLPQLLLYPNASHPLNSNAGFLMMRDKQQYEQKVKEYCELYAKRENILGSSAKDGSGSEDVSESEDASSDDEAADTVDGHAET